MSFSLSLLVWLCSDVTYGQPCVVSDKGPSLCDSSTNSTRCATNTTRFLTGSVRKHFHFTRTIAFNSSWYTSFALCDNLTSVLRNISSANCKHIFKIPIHFDKEPRSKGNVAYNFINFSIIFLGILKQITTNNIVFASDDLTFLKHNHSIPLYKRSEAIYRFIFKVFKCVSLIIYFMYMLYVFKSHKLVNIRMKWENSSKSHSCRPISIVSLTGINSLIDKNNVKDDKTIFRLNKIDYPNIKYAVYPFSSLNLLASYRPLLYIERPDSLFFSKLSSSGFFYPGRGVSVTCVSCDNSVELIRFVSEPSSAIYHKPGCEYVKEDNNDLASNTVLPQTNIPDPSSVPQDTNNDVHSNAVSSRSENNQTPEPSVQASSEYTSCNHHETNQQVSLASSDLSLANPSYPVYSEWSKRMTSFVNWPASHDQSSTELVNAGFFYAGYSDCVRCFYCGLGLRSWKPGDDIYVEHERYRPTCSYLHTLKRNRPQNNVNRNRVENGAENINSRRQSFSSTANVTGTVQQSVTEPTAASLQRSFDSGRQLSSNNVEVTQHEVTHHEVIQNEVIQHEVIQHEVMHAPDNSSTSISENRNLQNVTKTLLQRENQALKQLMKCKACNVAPIQDLFLPCGEMYTCKDCSSKFTHCPSCGKRILGTVKVYFT